MKRKLIYILLGLSLILNVLYFKYDTIDYLWPKIEEDYFEPQLLDISNYNEAEKIIVKSSLKMLESNEAVMIWDESYGLTRKLLEFNKTTHQSSFRRYNYPRAFLFYGLSEYSESISDTNNIKIISEKFNEYINEDGIPTFKLDKVDQIVFGLTAIKLEKYLNKNKYKKFIKYIDGFLIKNIDSTNVINYRMGKVSYLNDVLGLVVPYLVENKDTLLAEKQLTYFNQYGLDTTTFIPVHSFNRNILTKSGSSNWGRGIGWYYIALAHYYKATGELEKEYLGLTNTINKLKNTEGLWSQFPGSSDVFDASTSTMFLYGQALINPELYAKQEILAMFANYINEDGEILQTSGDTYAVNKYSATFGKSELSQGMLLLLLANAKK